MPVLLALALAASGLAATLAFWTYYASPLAGETFSYLLLFGSVLLIGLSLHGRRPDAALLRGLAIPLGLWALGSAFVLFLGFLHGGTDSPLEAAATRFSGQLPPDNQIPLFFADWFFENGHEGTPPVFPGDWLSSDRPPLQVGYVLAQRPFGWGDGALHYQVLGLVLQQLWIVGLWALLLAARVGRTTRALAMLAILVSGLAIVNGFYVWPKLLPAGMLLGAAALVMTPLWSEVRRSIWGAALVAALLGLAMLGHGSSVFGAVPLALIAAYRELPGLRWIGVGLLVGLVLTLPWLGYQQYGDPPGNRLTKWMLAGVDEIDDRSAPRAIVDSYREAGMEMALRNKGENFLAMAGAEATADTVRATADAIESGDPASAVREIRVLLFLHLLPSLGLLLLAPVAMLVAWCRRRFEPTEWGFALTCFAALGIGAVAWGLMLFGSEPARTVIHQGSYLLPVLGFCGAVAGLRAAYPRFAVYLVAVSALFVLAIYVPVLQPPEGTSFSPVAALGALAALCGFGALVFLARSGSAETNRLAR